MIIHIEIKANEETAPETVLIRVLKADNKTAETEAYCRADIESKLGLVEDKKMRNIESMFKYIDVNRFEIKEDKGFYELKTGLGGYKGEYEIRIVCISPGFKGVSGKIINNTNNPCEIKNNGKFVVC